MISRRYFEKNRMDSGSSFGKEAESKKLWCIRALRMRLSSDITRLYALELLYPMAIR